MRKTKMCKKKKIIMVIVIVAIACLIGGLTTLIYFGYTNGDMAFKGLYVNRLETKLQEESKGGIVFYGASNFRRWTDVNTDLAPYHIINCGFGGSTDKDMMYYADRLLYPFQPKTTFFQTGSNDFAVGLSTEEIISNKAKMYEEFRKELPDTTFVVMSALPLPGRSEYWESSQEVNAFLAEYCHTHENMIFIDATEVMMDTGSFRPEYFVEDQFHLNRDGQRAWASLILPVLDKLYGV